MSTTAAEAVARALDSDQLTERAAVATVLVAQLRWPGPQAVDLAGQILRTLGIDECSVCHCTDAVACLGGCWWVEPDLCSTCATALEEPPC